MSHMDPKRRFGLLLAITLLLGSCGINHKQTPWNTDSISELYRAAPNGVHSRWISPENPPQAEDENFPVTSTNFYQSDNVSATACFYLDRPENNLPELPGPDLRLKDLKIKVFQYRKYNI